MESVLSSSTVELSIWEIKINFDAIKSMKIIRFSDVKKEKETEKKPFIDILFDCDLFCMSLYTFYMFIQSLLLSLRSFSTFKLASFKSTIILLPSLSLSSSLFSPHKTHIKHIKLIRTFENRENETSEFFRSLGTMIHEIEIS